MRSDPDAKKKFSSIFINLIVLFYINILVTDFNIYWGKGQTVQRSELIIKYSLIYEGDIWVKIVLVKNIPKTKT